MVTPGAAARVEFEIEAAGALLSGDLSVPEHARGVVLFAHGSGSSRYSPRNRYVAERLQTIGLATALVDLLTVDEEMIDRRTAQLRFDVGLLGERVSATLDWLLREPRMADLPVGLFGTNTGAAAALLTAAKRADVVRAVVSRGGRPDLVGDALQQVRAPTLLIVGEADRTVAALNRQSARRLGGEHRLIIVPGAGRLFAEPGTLQRVGDLACAWLGKHLAGSDRPR